VAVSPVFHRTRTIEIHNPPSDYFAAVVRTHQGFMAPVQGKLLNYVGRVPLGVVAQITVGVSYYFLGKKLYNSRAKAAI